MKNIELSEKLRAKEDLENRGYKKKKCEKCDGTGYNQTIKTALPRICLSCEGDGGTWIAPLMR